MGVRRWFRFRLLPIDGYGLAYLSELPHLETLSLSRSRISDDTLDGLLQIRTLKRVGLQETRVSPEGVRRVHAALPACQLFD